MINLPTAADEWGPPQFWGAGEDDWGLMGWSGYVKHCADSSHCFCVYHWKIVQPKSTLYALCVLCFFFKWQVSILCSLYKYSGAVHFIAFSWLLMTMGHDLDCSQAQLPTEYVTYLSKHLGKFRFTDIRKLFLIPNKAKNLRDLIAVTGLVILLKLDSNLRFFKPCDVEIWWVTPTSPPTPPKKKI